MKPTDRRDDPHRQADERLAVWGANHDLIRYGLFPGTQEQGHEGPPERVDSSGHSDPTCQLAMRREHLLRIDSAVRAVIPERLRQRLYEQYVEGLTAPQAAERHGMGERSWRQERNEARIIFWNVYQDRRRLVRATRDGERTERRARDVVDDA